MRVLVLQDTLVRIHPLALIGALYFLAFGNGEMVLCGFAALLLHEVAHVATAKAFRFTVPEMEITPFGGVAKIEDLQQATPVQQFFIAVAGPFANWVCCLICAWFVQMQWANPYTLQHFVHWNMLLLCFNLIPVLPLDGGRIAQALLSPLIGWERAAKALSFAGILLGLALVGLSIFGALNGVANLSLMIAGCYLMYAANLSKTMAAAQCIHSVISKKVKLEHEKALRVESLGVARKITVKALFRRMSPGKYHRVFVMDEDGLTSIGELDDGVLVNALLDTPNETVENLLKKQRT